MDVSDADRIKNLRKALAATLDSLHDYSALMEAELKVAVDDAEINPDWSCHNPDEWTAMAYPEKQVA